MALQRQKREQDLKEQRELERQSPSRKKGAGGAAGGAGGAAAGGGGGAAGGAAAGSAAASLLCARKSNKRKKLSSPFKKGEEDWLSKMDVHYGDLWDAASPL